MKIGYARVSTKEQKLNLQIDALTKEGCEKIYYEKVSGADSERPELNKLLENMRAGDTIIIWKLDRLGRTLKDLINLVTTLKQKGVGIRSLNDPVDTTTPTGNLVFNLFACLAEFERDTNRERTKAGLEAARARGKKGGRPRGLSPEAEAKAKTAEILYKSGKMSVSEMIKQIDISRRTFYKYLEYRNVQLR